MARYQEEIRQLTNWFKKRLEKRTPFEMREEDYEDGTDRLLPRLARLIKQANRVWREERGWELSYNQLNVAFFAAARELGKLKLVPYHPVFRLHTRVFVREYVCESIPGVYLNVPGRITSVRRGEHVVVLEAAVEGSEAGRRCVILKTDELDKELKLRA